MLDIFITKFKKMHLQNLRFDYLVEEANQEILLAGLLLKRDQVARDRAKDKLKQFLSRGFEILLPCFPCSTNIFMEIEYTFVYSYNILLP